MRVLVFALAPLWSPHYETDLELAAKHRAAGDQVVVVACRGDLQSCIANPYHRKLDCIACRSKCDSGLDAIDFDRSRLITISAPSEGPLRVPGFSSIEELRAYTYDGLPLGNAAASSLVSILRDSNPDLTRHADLVRRIVTSAIEMKANAEMAMEEHEPDLVYAFNGRFATAAPIVEVCQRLGVRFRTHDALYSPGQYLIAESASVHDLDSLKRQIDRSWVCGESDPAGRSDRASEFFEQRRYGGAGGGPAHLRFSSSQVPGRVPLKSDQDYVAILNSSEDEFVSLNQYENPIYPDQNVGLEAILDDPRLANIQFILRVHPNLSGLVNDQTRHLDSLGSRRNLEIVSADDAVDTYSLIEHARAVVTFGSTTGIEAVYWGTPSILIGRAAFEDLGPRRPIDHSQVVSWILDPPPISDPQGALKYGYFMLEGGQVFEHYDQSGYYTGLVRGSRVRAKWIVRHAVRGRNAMRLASERFAWKRRADNRTLSQR